MEGPWRGRRSNDLYQTEAELKGYIKGQYKIMQIYSSKAVEYKYRPGNVHLKLVFALLDTSDSNNHHHGDNWEVWACIKHTWKQKMVTSTQEKHTLCLLARGWISGRVQRVSVADGSIGAPPSVLSPSLSQAASSSWETLAGVSAKSRPSVKRWHLRHQPLPSAAKCF